MYVIYSKDNCPNCEVAIKLLPEATVLKLGVEYEREDLLKLLPNCRSVPQIFKDGVYLGDLKRLKEVL
jgi:glutaredoxin